MKLPKDLIADPKHDAVMAALTREPARLWERGTLEVGKVPATPALFEELSRALRLGYAVQGLESISSQLMREQKGLDALGEKGPKTARVSRVLFITNDGSERFYRECESLLLKYQSRLLVCWLPVTGDELGKELFGEPKLVRAVMVSDKKAAARVLLALA